MPDFIVIGAVKAGTTSLFHYLKQHPSIRMSAINWPRFFHVDGTAPDFESRQKSHGSELAEVSLKRYSNICNPRIPKTFEQYLSLWPKSVEEYCQGEVSPTYLHDPAVAPRILRRLPKVKLIVVLRQPVDRAYSHYIMDVRAGWEKELSFVKVIKEEPYKIDDFWWGHRHNIRHGLYTARVAEYLQLFHRDQLLFLRYEDLKNQPEIFFKRLFAFLQLDTSVSIDTSVKHNPGLLHYRKEGSDTTDIHTMRPSELPNRFHGELTEFFRSDILALQDLIGQDLSDWLSPKTLKA